MKPRIILLFFAVLSCITAVFGAFAFHQQAQSTRQHEAYALAGQAADFIAINFDQALTNHREVIASASQLDVIKDFLMYREPQQVSVIKSALDTLCYSASGALCYVLASNGELQANNTAADIYDLKGKNFSKRNYFKNALQNGVDVSLVKKGDSNKRCLYFSHRVTNSAGHVIGVVVMKLSPEKLGLEFSGFSDIAALVGPDGIVFASNQHQWVLKPIKSQVAHHLISARQSQRTIEEAQTKSLVRNQELLVTTEAERYLAGAAPILSLDGWSIWYLLEEDVVLARQPYTGFFYGFIIMAALMLLVTLILYRSAMVDMVRRRKAEQLVVESEARLRRLTELSSEAILIHIDATIIDCNGAAEALFGYSRQTLLGQNIWILFGQDSINTVRKHITNHHSLPYEVIGLRQNGECFPLEVVGKQSEFDEQKAYVSCFTDISKRKAQEEKIRFLALFDGLTQLPNRHHMLEKLDSAIYESDKENTPIHLMFIDLDDFKKINDTLGHAAGDRLLVAVAARMRQVIEKNELLARYGGDEFLVLLVNKPATRVSQLAESILDALRQPFVLSGSTFYISGSVGIACYPEQAATASELLQKADTAMYSSKDNGRNTFNYFNTQMNRNTTERVQIEQCLRGALERKELFLEYQPMFSAQTGELVAAEALIRWQSPELGRVGPDKFIPVAESTGLIQEIGCWVLEQACIQAQQWIVSGVAPFYISVNLSPKQFRDPSLISHIQNIIFQTGLSTDALFLEITEGVLVKDDKTTKHVMMDLARLGIGLAMDDFGTGYSSLSYLKRFPFNTLKIDREFVRDLESDPNDQQLIVATIAMAKGLGLKVVAEGVENESQQVFLQNAGCHYLQGYLLSKPISAELFSERYVQQTPRDELSEALL